MGPLGPTASPSALWSLLCAAEGLITSDASDASGAGVGAALTPLVDAALASAGEADEGGAPPRSCLERALAQLGWRCGRFERPVAARVVLGRLKACLYTDMRQVGSGTYSVVFSARHRLTGQKVTLKRIWLGGEPEGLPSNALREVSMLQEMAGCPHVVRQGLGRGRGPDRGRAGRLPTAPAFRARAALVHPTLAPASACRPPPKCRLLDVLWDERRLYLVMESMDRDLREHLDLDPGATALPNVKARWPTRF